MKIIQFWKGNEDENGEIESIQNVEPSLTNLTYYIIYIYIYIYICIFYKKI